MAAAEADSLTLEVATPVGLALRTEASAVQVWSVNGEFGVLPGHLPLLAALRAGPIKYIKEGKEHFAAIGGGFVEVEPDRVLVLTDVFASPESIKVEAVREELEEAEEALAAFPNVYEGPEFEELNRTKNWAVARLLVAEIRDKI